ncbi:hypothetical protein [Rhodanobacter ginsengiterrae]|uniref:hypothetical protein n=1 Tax=Rhodanobacter ginsengiterrae TaxID=2008451 RepID=UPI003CF8D1EC
MALAAPARVNIPVNRFHAGIVAPVRQRATIALATVITRFNCLPPLCHELAWVSLAAKKRARNGGHVERLNVVEPA